MNYAVLAAAGQVAQALENVSLDGVFSEYLALIPILIPVTISFIAVRKGLGFVISTLRNA